MVDILFWEVLVVNLTAILSQMNLEKVSNWLGLASWGASSSSFDLKTSSEPQLRCWILSIMVLSLNKMLKIILNDSQMIKAIRVLEEILLPLQEATIGQCMWASTLLGTELTHGFGLRFMVPVLASRVSAAFCYRLQRFLEFGSIAFQGCCAHF